MKKLIISGLALLLLVACSGSDKKIDQESLVLYKTYWDSILNETQYQSTSRNFDIDVEMVKEGSTYDYYVTIDNAKVAMYDVEIVVVEDKKSYNEMDDMLPSAGIFEKKFNLVPHQARIDKAFMDGANLVRLDLPKDEVTLQVLVTWKNYTKLESFKEIFEFDVKYTEPVKDEVEKTEGVDVEEDIEEVEDES